MKYRIIAIFVLAVFVLNIGASTFADAKIKRSAASELVSLLPASDGVVTFDVRRFLDEALPKLLASNQTMLGKVTGEIDKIQEKVGIDVRQFDHIAAGVTTKRISDKDYDMDPVVIARGQTSSASLIGAAKLAAKGKYREEMIGDRTIYIFEGKKIAAASKPQAGNAKADAAVEKAIEKMSSEIAVAAVDSTTIAFGSPARVRQTIEAKTKVGLDITGLLERNQTSIVNFAGKLPAGVKSFIPLDNDELGKNIDAIQYVYGNANVVADVASLNFTARTQQNAQAKSLYETLSGLQMLGKGLLSGAKGADKQAYKRMIENAKISVKANEIVFDLQVPQSDIDIIVATLK